MKSPLYFIFVLIPFLFSCQQSNETKQALNNCKTELAEKSDALDMALVEIKNLTVNAPLVHTVYLTLKSETSKEETATLIAACKVLRDIPTVKNLEVGRFKELGDDRALSQYGLVLQMDFSSEEDYQSYQQDSIHLAFKKIAGPYLGAPPVTHDFLKQ